jgi:hypothetical protein
MKSWWHKAVIPENFAVAKFVRDPEKKNVRRHFSSIKKSWIPAFAGMTRG